MLFSLSPFHSHQTDGYPPWAWFHQRFLMLKHMCCCSFSLTCSLEPELPSVTVRRQIQSCPNVGIWFLHKRNKWKKMVLVIIAIHIMILVKSTFPCRDQTVTLSCTIKVSHCKSFDIKDQRDGPPERHDKTCYHTYKNNWGVWFSLKARFVTLGMNYEYFITNL